MRELALGGAPLACFMNVDIPLSIGAQILAKRQVEAYGLVPLEIAFPAQPFFDELAKRGIQVEQEIEERGRLAS